jgi:hypothetical protein
MPKKRRRANARARKTSRPKRALRSGQAARASRMPARTRAPMDADADVDGCDIQVTAGDATPDAELPKATGGVEAVPRGRR